MIFISKGFFFNDYMLFVYIFSAVVSCLQSFAQSDAFFSRCHAVYGKM